MNPFSEKLKTLRGNMTVEELAKISGVAASSIYKMESTERVRWQTVERAYGPTFRDEQEHLVTLVLWALEQTERKVAMYRAAETAKSLLREDAHEVNACAVEIARITARMKPPQASRLLEFARCYAASDPARRMVEAWLEMVEAEKLKR